MTPRIYPQVSYYHTYICFLNPSVFLFKIEMPMFSFYSKYPSNFYLREVIHEKNTSLAGREPRRIYPGHLPDRHDSDHGDSGIMQICSWNVSVLVRGTYQISVYLASATAARNVFPSKSSSLLQFFPAEVKHSLRL